MGLFIMRLCAGLPLFMILTLQVLTIQQVLAAQCGSQAGGAVCPGGLCCSGFGFCGNTPEYCTNGCQSQCRPGGSSTPSTPTATGGGDIGSLISRDSFEMILKHHNDANCPARGFYTYDAFIAAAKSFPTFATAGSADTRKREIAAFLAQTSHETTGGWLNAPDGPYAWGYCFIEERENPPGNPRGDYCTPNQQYPCAPGKKYYGRGPIQISHNYNYGPAGRAINEDLLNNPDLVAKNPIISFKTAFWFWMTPQSPKPSCHDVITGNWRPTAADTQAGRVPGYGVITNIINGGKECGIGSNQYTESRIGFYKRYCDIMGVGYGNNLDCANQRHFNA